MKIFNPGRTDHFEFVRFWLTLSGQIFNFVISLIGNSGYAGIFALMAAEGATLPVPSEIVLPFAGYLAFRGELNFWFIVLVATVGAIVGALVDYAIGYYLGRPAILRYGRYVRLSEKHLIIAEKWFSKHGELAVFLAKFVPLVRTLISFPAGIGEMKMWRFVVFSAIGAILWNTILVYVGFVAGQNSTAIMSALSNDFTLVEILVVVILVVGGYRWFTRKPPVERPLPT
jgi:membrane protein DedA with SNARE-associated domain